jgi:hypothetical protein
VAASANQVETSPANPRPPPLRLALVACKHAELERLLALRPPDSTRKGGKYQGRVCPCTGGGDEVEGQLDEVG